MLKVMLKVMLEAMLEAMNEPERQLLDRMITLPPVRWEGFVDSLSAEDRDHLASAAKMLCVGLAMIAGYVDMRRQVDDGDRGHAVAVGNCNKARRAVRKALGLDYSDDLRF